MQSEYKESSHANCLFLQMHVYIAALRGFTSSADSLICKFQTRLLQITDPYDHISRIRLLCSICNVTAVTETDV